MSQDIISFSYLSKFEKGESDVTLSVFIRLITRLNMTLDEFLFFNDIQTTEYGELYQKISLAYNRNDQKKLLLYLKKEKTLYLKTNVIYHKCNAIMIGSIIQDIDKSFSVSQEEKNFIVNYIINCSFWSTYEVSLIGNILTFFSEDLLIIIIKEIKKRLEEYRVSRKNVRDLIALLQNACIIFLRSNNIKEVKSLSIFLESFLSPSFFYEKARQLFINGLILIQEGEKNLGGEKARQAIDLMKIMDLTFANDHEAELKSFLKTL